MQSEIHELLRFDGWVVLGLIGQALFTGRFLVQWIASERSRRSVVPVWFWYLSMIGGSVSLIYALGIGSLPFALGQITGLFVYTRNLMLIRRGARSQALGSRTGMD
jgi:lipid-A-disaccharide synthase-like uncharacterized protein